MVVVEVAQYYPFDVLFPPVELVQGGGKYWSAIGPAGVEHGHALGAEPKVGVEQVGVAPRNAHSVKIGYEFEHVHVLGHDLDVSERAPPST